jgi:hypothetical protein
MSLENRTKKTATFVKTLQDTMLEHCVLYKLSPPFRFQKGFYLYHFEYVVVYTERIKFKPYQTSLFGSDLSGKILSRVKLPGSSLKNRHYYKALEFNGYEIVSASGIVGEDDGYP